MFSRTVSSMSSVSSWGTTPSRSRIFTPSLAGSSPKTRSVPSVTRGTQPIMRIVEVFPAPFGPRKPKASPRLRSKSTPSTARSSPKDFTSPRAWISEFPFSLATDRTLATRGGAATTARRVLQTCPKRTVGSPDAPDRRALRGRVHRPPLRLPPRVDAARAREGGRVCPRARGRRRLQAAQLDDASHGDRGGAGPPRRAQEGREVRGPARDPLARGAERRPARDGRGGPAREGRRRGAPPGAAGGEPGRARRAATPRPARVADRRRPRRPHVPRRGGRLGRSRGEARGGNRLGRAVVALPGAHPPRSRARRVPRCPGGTAG